MRTLTPRTALVLALACGLPAAALADGPLTTPGVPAAATGEGMVVRLEPGFAMWHLSANTLEPQVGSRAGEIPTLMIGETKNAFAMTLGIGYDIKGQVTLGLELTGTGWNIGSSNRGGAGLSSFTVAWHPLASFVHTGKMRVLDVSIFAGAGWGVVGQDRAMRGLIITTGIRAEAYLAPWISMGATLRWDPLFFNRYVINWNAGQGIDLPKGSGGSVLVPAFTLAFHMVPGG